jgi:hypothetical protein
MSVNGRGLEPHRGRPERKERPRNSGGWRDFVLRVEKARNETCADRFARECWGESPKQRAGEKPVRAYEGESL